MARRGKIDIPKRRPKQLKKVSFRIQKKTAENILKLNSIVEERAQALAEAQGNLQNHVLPLLTERGIMNGTVIEVTEKEPYELVLMVPK